MTADDRADSRHMDARHLDNAPLKARRAPRKPARSGGLNPLPWLKRRFRARPGATIAHGLFAVAGLAIIVNAISWQSGGERRAAAQTSQPGVAAATPPLPPTRPADLAAAPRPVTQTASQPAQQTGAQSAAPAPTSRQTQPTREAAAREPATREPAPPRDAIGDLIRTGMVPGMDAPRPPGSVPGGAMIERASLSAANDRPVLAAQRALNKLNMGPVREDGRFGEGTRAAIESFERERRIPVTRDLSPRTLRELAAASGIRME